MFYVEYSVILIILFVIYVKIMWIDKVYEFYCKF